MTTISLYLGRPNRWIVEVSCEEAAQKCVSSGIEICSKLVQIKPYDEVLQAEYEEYARFSLYQKGTQKLLNYD